MNPPVLNRQQVRRLDRRAIDEFGMSGLVLMENAGRGVADVLQRTAPSGPIVLCCGKGNNGGDGFVIARHLDLRGVAVRVLAFFQPQELTGDAAVNFRILQRCDVPIDVFDGPVAPERLPATLADAAWLVDALLGTGATGDPRPPLDVVIAAMNAAGPPILAVDLPSGLDCDTGAAGRPTIRATRTCTFVAMKPGFLAPGAEQFTGSVQVLDIGAPRRLVEAMLSESPSEH
jgi:NAD(P)H-hydrate epimerase